MSARTGFFRDGGKEKKLETRKLQKTAGGQGQRWQRWRPGNFYYILLFISNGNVKNSHETNLSEVGFGAFDSVAFGFNRAWEERRFPNGEPTTCNWLCNFYYESEVNKAIHIFKTFYLFIRETE